MFYSTLTSFCHTLIRRPCTLHCAAARVTTKSLHFSSITFDCHRRPKCGLSYHSLGHALSLSLPLSHTHTHTHKYTHAAAEATTVTEQFSNFCNLCKLDQNSSMLIVMIMEHDTENIKSVPAPLSFWFHHLYMHQTEQFSQNVLW